MLQLQKRCSALEIGEEGDLPSGEVSEIAELQICFCTKGKRRAIAVGESLVCEMETPIYHTDLNSWGFAAYQMLRHGVLRMVC